MPAAWAAAREACLEVRQSFCRPSRARKLAPHRFVEVYPENLSVIGTDDCPDKSGPPLQSTNVLKHFSHRGSKDGKLM